MAGVRFRGLSPHTALTRWGLAAVALGIVIGGTGPEAIGLAARSFGSGAASLPWIASRLLAFLAYLALAFSVVYGLLLSTKLLDAIAHRPISFALHQDLASIGLGLAAIHGALLALDRMVPSSLGQLMIPFATPYRPLWVGVGQLSLYLMAAVVGSFYVRRHIGQRTWRLLHYLTFLSFIGATAHGVFAGTDTGAWGRWVYVAATAIVTFLFTYRVVMALANRPTARVRPTAAQAAGLSHPSRQRPVGADR